MIKRGLLRIGLGVVGLVLLVVAVLGLAQLAVVYQPVSPAAARADLPTSSPWVTVRVDEGIFTLFAALNASGFDRENFDQPYHPARQLVRERLAGKTFAGQERLRAELGFINTYNFVVWALHYGPPPDFRRVTAWDDASIPALLFYGLDGQLRRFYTEMDIASLWQEVRPLYEQEAARYQAAAGQAVQAALEYTRLQDVPLRQVVVIPNLLGAHWNGNGPTVGDTAYVVIGPTGDQPDVALVQHEALHSIAGPLVEANLSAIDAEHAKALHAALRGRVPGSYGTWESLLEEQVVRAIECRLHPQECGEFLLANDEAEGFLLERALIERLGAFEQSDRTLAEFMPDLLGALNDVQLDQ